MNSASRNGDHGSLQLISQASDIPAAISALPWGIYAIVALVDVNSLEPSESDGSGSELLEALRVEERVAGILLYVNRTSASGIPGRWSEDAACPNEQFSFYGEDEG